MTVFHCAACGIPVTAEVELLAELPEERYRDADDREEPGVTVPRGSYAIDPDPFGAPYVVPEQPLPPPAPANCRVPGGPQGTLVLHPDDGLDLRPHPEHRRSVGCCGSSGVDGRNLVCRCGGEIGTLVGDCWTAQELRLDPGCVRGTA